MKKIFYFIAAFILITACDDGDMTFKTFNFDDVAVQTCGDDIFYKVNGTEVLLLRLNPVYLQNVETDGPQTLQLSGTNTITYRNYSGTGAQNTLCSDVPASDPTVIDEWQGEGNISIETDPIYDAQTGLLTAYNHKIFLIDVSFTKGDEEIRIVNSDFGSLQTNLGFNFDFEFTEENLVNPSQCGDSNILYKIRSDETLVFQFEDDALLGNVEGTETKDFETDEVSLLYNIYNGSAGSNNVCQNYVLSPQLEQKWEATEGTVTVITTYNSDADGYEHEIYFKDVVFTNVSNPEEMFTITDIKLLENEAMGLFFGTY